MLVLDAGLLCHHAEDSNYYEVFTRITCSNWIRRLWTLQEATLNLNLLFQFSNRAVYVGNASTMAHIQSDEQIFQPWNLVAWECSRLGFDWKLGFAYLSTAGRMNFIWQATQYRTTSRTGDETLCIGTLLDLDLEALQKEPAASSVQKFWSLHEKCGVPAAVLFAPGEKFEIEGLGWAPKNLMRVSFVGVNFNSLAKVTPRGLQVAYPGIFLGAIERAVKTVLAVMVERELFFIRQNLITGKSWEGLNLHERKDLSVIISALGVKEGRTTTGGLERGLGALVEGTAWGSDCVHQVHHVRYLRYVSVIKANSFYDLHPNHPWSAAELQEKLLPPLEGMYTGEDQMWCVG